MHKNNNPTLYIDRVISLYVFIVVACPAHILLSKKGIEMKLGLYIDGSENHNLPCIFTELSPHNHLVL